MTMTPAYLFTIPGNDSIQVTQDELRSLLSKIEAELHNSKVYLLAMNTLQNLLGHSGEPIKILLKAVGREAITLAFQQMLQPEKFTETHNIAPSVTTETTSESSSIDVKSPTSSTDITENEILSESPANYGEKSSIKSPIVILKKWFHGHIKTEKPDTRQSTLAQQRLEMMSIIGQKLKEARQDRGLSLYQLNIYTHIPIHRMEAIENSNFDLLPEDTLVRSFIRSMGNAVGLNGTMLAASLPADKELPSLTRSWKNSSASGEVRISLSPMHLYVGYTALIAGSVGGLSLTSQQFNTGRVLNQEIVNCPSASVSPSSQISEVCIKSGLKSGGMDANISPPETF